MLCNVPMQQVLSFFFPGNRSIGSRRQGWSRQSNIPAHVGDFSRCQVQMAMVRLFMIWPLKAPHGRSRFHISSGGLRKAWATGKIRSVVVLFMESCMKDL